MNKDFFTKPISLKDIKFEKIDLKNIKNKKEIIIGVLILAYIIIIFILGSNLLKTRSEVKEQYEIKQQKYEALGNALTEENLKKQIDQIIIEKEKLADKIEGIKSINEFTEIFNEFEVNAPITWESEKIAIKSETKESLEYDIFSIDILSFTGTFEQIEDFLRYVDNYNKIVRIESLDFRRSSITGKLIGDIKITFYFKKLSI